jgi:hypothetical protein
VQPLRTAKPAPARREEPVSKVEQLGSGLDQSNTPQSNTPKASEPQAPDDRGEDDLTFFSRRPNVDARIRLPFNDEFPDELLRPGAFVHVLLIRDPLTNAPRTRARAIFYSDIDGGNA